MHSRYCYSWYHNPGGKDITIVLQFLYYHIRILTENHHMNNHGIMVTNAGKAIINHPPNPINRWYTPFPVMGGLLLCSSHYFSGFRCLNPRAFDL